MGKNSPDIEFSPTTIKLEKGRSMTSQKKIWKIGEPHFKNMPTFRIYVETRTAKLLKEYLHTEKYLTVNEKKYVVIDEVCKICFEPTEVQIVQVAESLLETMCSCF